MKLYAIMLALCSLFVGSADAGQFGTGFAISPKGYLVTCFHVIRGADRVIVHCQGGYLQAQIVALDPQNDLAILKVEGWKGRYLGLNSSSEVTQTSPVMAAGFPDPTVLGRNPKVTTGIVNALSGVRDDPRYIQISAPVQPGNSGGPLLSETGRVIGVVAAGLNSMDRMTHGGYLPQSVNYAIKADLIFPLLKTASISLPKFGARVPVGPKQVERTISAIALIEGLGRGEPMYGGQVPRPPTTTPLPLSPSDLRRKPPVLTSFQDGAGRAPNPRGPWIFPDSHLRPLHPQEVAAIPHDDLWRARNEIYLRHGYIFPSAQGKRFAQEFSPQYRPTTPSADAIKARLTPIEIGNLQLIARYEQ